MLYFSSIDSNHGRELWRSDGTQAGTWLIEDLVPGTGSSMPVGAVSTKGNLTYLVEDYNTGLPALRRLLWPGFSGQAAVYSQSDGRIRLKFTELLSRPHSIDRSPDLSIWTPVEKLTLLTDGTLEYFPSPPITGPSFFRIWNLTIQPALQE